MKIQRVVLLRLVVVAIVLSFCGVASATAAPNISGTLVYWALWNEGEQQQVATAETIAAFEKAFPNVKVNVTWAGREVLTKARSALLAGTQLDLVDTAADELNAALII